MLRLDGVLLIRNAERPDNASKSQLPPRFTRVVPDAAPSGSVPSSALVAANQSRQYSQTLPWVS